MRLRRLPVAAGLDTAELAEYLSTHNYAKLGDIPSLPDLSVYATEVWVASQGYLTEHQDISHLVSKDELEEMFVWVTRADGSRYIKAKAGVVGPWLSTPGDYAGSPGGALAAGRLAALEDVGLSALSEGDVLVWDGSKWTNQQVSVGGGDAYLPLTGGTLKNGVESNLLILDTDGAVACGVRYQFAGVNKAWIGYHHERGVNMYNNVCDQLIGIKNDGTPHYSNNTLLHAGNYADILDSRYVRSSFGAVNYKWEWGSGLTHVLGVSNGVSGEIKVFSGAEIRNFANAVNKSGDTMTGAITFAKTATYALINGVYDAAGNTSNVVWCDGTGKVIYGSPLFSEVILETTASGTVYHQRPGAKYKIWDAGNDGAGSGLDADMLDGYQSTNFVRALYAAEVDTNRDMSDMHSNMTFIGSVNGTANTPNGAGWYNVIQLAHRNGVSDGAQYVGQIALGMTVNHERMYYRTHRNRGWQTVARLSDNVASATKLANTCYLWGNAFTGENGVSGTLQVTGVNNTDQGMIVTGSQAQIGFIIGSGNVNRGIYDYTNGSWMIYRDASTSIHMGGTVTSYQSYPMAFRTSTGSCDWLFYHDGSHFYINQASAKGQTALGAYRPIALRNDGWIGLAGWAIVAYNGGNVGIGYNTYTPTLSYKLDVNGDIRATSNIEITSYGSFRRSSINNNGSSWNMGEAAFAAGIVNNGNQTPILMAVRAGAGWDTSGANRLFAMELLNSGGQLWMAFGGAQRYQFTSGGVFYASAGIWSNGYVSGKGNAGSSDARLKRGLEPIELTVRDIAGAPLVEFDWADGSGRDMGTIAQYWLTRCKRAVRETPDGYYALDYGKLAVAIGISLARKVADHERRLDKHEMRLDNLERRMAA